MENKVLYLLFFLLINVSFAKKINTEGLIIIPYEQVEVKPLFPGGMNEFMKFVMKNFHLPEEEEVPTGTIQVSMVIDKSGNVTNVQIISDLGNAGNEIKRVLSKCPKWQPGRMKGENVDVEYVFPITIK